MAATTTATTKTLQTSPATTASAQTDGTVITGDRPERTFNRTGASTEAAKRRTAVAGGDVTHGPAVVGRSVVEADGDAVLATRTQVLQGLLLQLDFLEDAGGGGEKEKKKKKRKGGEEQRSLHGLQGTRP